MAGPHLTDQFCILLVLMVAVASHFAIGTIGNVSLNFRKCVPYARALSILFVSSLYLEEVSQRTSLDYFQVPYFYMLKTDTNLMAIPDKTQWRLPKQNLLGKCHTTKAPHIWS